MKSVVSMSNRIQRVDPSGYVYHEKVHTYKEMYENEHHEVESSKYSHSVILPIPLMRSATPS